MSTTDQSCKFCKTNERQFFSMDGKYANEIRIAMESLFPTIPMEKVERVGTKCWKKIEEFYNFKNQVESNFFPKRACTSTPQKDESFKRRKPDLEGILSSMEKLNLMAAGSKPKMSGENQPKRKLSFTPPKGSGQIGDNRLCQPFPNCVDEQMLHIVTTEYRK